MEKQYPKNYTKSESGCKVGWLTYRLLKDARACSKVAIQLAEFYRSKGYEYGYSVPGYIEKTKQGYRVTIP